MEIGDRIKLLRKTLNLSQTAVAKRIDIANASLSQLENNITKPSLNTIRELGVAYNVNANWLLTGEGEMFTEEFAAKVDSDFQKSVDWMIEFCQKVRKGEIEQTPEIEEILKSIAKITKIASDKGGSK